METSEVYTVKSLAKDYLVGVRVKEIIGTYMVVVINTKYVAQKCIVIILFYRF